MRGGLPAVTGGTCTTRPGASADTAVRCVVKLFNEDGDASTGRETGCPAVADGTCTTCSGASGCAVVSYDAGHGDEDGDAST